MTEADLLKKQLALINKLQEVSQKRPILIQHRLEDRWHSLPCKHGKLIQTRGILPREIVLDFDGDTWKDAAGEAKKLKAYLDAEGIPYWLAWTGGKGIHVHIFLNPSNEPFENGIQAAIKSGELDVLRIFRETIAEHLTQEAKLDRAKAELDPLKVSWSMDTKGSMIREFGAMREDGGCKTLIDTIPDERPKPGELPLRFPSEVKLWDVAEFHQLISPRLKQQTEAMRREEVDTSDYDGIALDVPCVAFLMKGLDEGTRNRGAHDLARLEKLLKVSKDVAEKDLIAFAHNCKGYDSELEKEVLGTFEGVWKRKEKHNAIGCRTLKDTYGAKVCDKERCPVAKARDAPSEQDKGGDRHNYEPAQPYDGPEISSLSEAIEKIRVVARFNSDLDYYALLLWAAQTRMRGVLPESICLYLGLVAKMSAGKTTILEVCARIAHKGVMYESVTDAALKRTMLEGPTLCIDELDEHIKKDENLATTVRVGNKWTATAALCIKKGSSWETEEMQIGGPKAFTLRGELEDALRSRTIQIVLPSIMDVGLIANSFFIPKRVAPIKDWLDRVVSERVQAGNWTPERVEATMMSQEFQDRVAKIKVQLPRNWQQAFILLLMNDIIGWDLGDKIVQILEAQEYDDPYEQEKEIIANYCLARKQDQSKEKSIDIPGTKDKQFVHFLETVPLEIKSYELSNALNQELYKRGRKQLNRSEFAKLKREIGWQDQVNSKKDSAKGGKVILTLDEPVLTNLGIWNRFEPLYTLGPYPGNTKGD